MENQIPIVLFDGACSLCHKSVQFCLKYENIKINPPLHFASLQSEFGQKILAEHKMPPHYIESVLFKDSNGKLHSKSSGLFQMAKYLNPPFYQLKYFSVIPTFLTDFVYMLIAKSRYQIFGKLDQCMLPSESKDMKSRFLS